MSTVDDFKNKAVATKEPANTFPAMLKTFLPEIQRALPAHLSGDRMSRIALTAFRRTPKLADCDPRSVFAAVIQASQLGLEPDTMGRAYLIPYGRECQFVPGWKGLVDLMNRSGAGTVWTGAVYEGDIFDYQLGDSPHVKHKPMGEDDPTKLTHVYAIGRTKGAEWPIIEVWPATKIYRHRDRYNKVGKRHYSHENIEMYARKVPLLQVLKYMPCSAELVAAMGLNDAAEIGAQGLTVQDAVDGTWAPPAEEVGQRVIHPEKEAPAPAKQAGSAMSYETLVARFGGATDIDMLKADAELIDLLPAGDQEAAREVYIERLDIIGRK